MPLKQRLGATPLLLLACLLVLLIACSEAEPIAQSTPTPEATATVVDVTSEPLPLNGLANIESAEFVLSNSFPIDVSLRTTGTLPDGCTTIDGKSQSRTGNAFSLELTTKRDPDRMCTEALVLFEEIFELDVAGLTAGTYTVNVNGVVQTFVLAVDNAMAEPTATPEPTQTPEPTAEPTQPAAALPEGNFKISGSVFHDLCAVADASAAEDVPEASEGCITVDEGGYAANGLLEADEPPLIGIAIKLGAGACPVTDLFASAETDESGQFQFSDIPSGEYCVAIAATEEPNASVLIPGAWTTHSDDASVALTLGADTELPPFGWDYQFLPIPAAQQGETLTRAGCVDLFAFDGDVTIADDTPFEPGAPIVKTWRLINTGSCTWTDGYALTYLRGDKMDAPDEVAITNPVVPGESIDITVEMVAPAELGTYRGDWIMRSDFDRLFGVGGDAEAPIWLQIEVVEQDTVGGISGLIWHDACDQSAYTFGDPTLPQGCLQNTNGTIRGDGLYDTEREDALPEITLNLGTGACGQTEFVRRTFSAEDGTYSFPNLLAGTYCIYIEVLTDANYSKLIPGNFTVPQPGRSGITVTLEPNAEFNSINFAWDFLEE